MLSSLQIQNFRGLKDVKIGSLGRVNLIVGENNAGKSSVLEALLVYASGANPYALDYLAGLRQEETLSGQYQLKQYNFLNQDYLTFASIFYKRQYPKQDDQNICIGELNNKCLSLSYDKDKKEIVSQSPLGERHFIPLFILNDNHYLTLSAGKQIVYGIHISSTFSSGNVLAQVWEKIIFTPYENEVISSLKIIEPDIEKLAFVSNPFNSNDRIPIVGLKNSDKPVPLYSMGDGIKRILQLILNLHQARDGLLLIDEFDNGLHYKVQEKVWGLLFELAERFNVQVFATTHSNDCIRAFSNISQERTDIDGMLIQMTKEHYKDGTSQIVANVVDEESLQCLLNLGIDVR